FRGYEPRNVEKRISLDEVSIVSKDRPPRHRARTISTRVTSPLGEDDPHRCHLVHRRGRPTPRHLAHGRGRPAQRSPRPWERTTRTKVTSPMGEDDPRRDYLAHGQGPTTCPKTVHPRLSHLAHGRGRPTPRSPRPWARTTRAEITSTIGEDDPTKVTSPMGEDRPPVPKPCFLV
ncbi:hypothetical protein HID58_074385, partial [Brassica napus]